ncbi:hypothetical protein [Shewanella sp. OMA3-2]|uniref:hypothetical protein n=1 Tax=Shewanella sp. OMA3-2 TaxID=2908650 RepID=UPI001F2DB290|nr:hypothetical protein [Shewanella sp. OMA3-2]UJF21953.1 hypothetical protein L0B17_00310 [Shewanella sp. OMA3-2]
MFSNFLKVFFILLLVFSDAHANMFSIEPLSDHQYTLKTPNSLNYNVIVEMQGANELSLKGEFLVSCLDKKYIIPVIQRYVDNAESNSEHIEYFVFEKITSGFNALKSISSFYVVDRESGEIFSKHILTEELSNNTTALCEYINTESELDSPIEKVQKLDTN